jgi:hypothetical protein
MSVHDLGRAVIAKIETIMILPEIQHHTFVSTVTCSSAAQVCGQSRRGKQNRSPMKLFCSADVVFVEILACV